MIRLFPSYIREERKKVFTDSVTLSEVVEALKYFKKDKAPSPNGWPVKFYLTFIDFLGPLLVDLVEFSRILGSVAPSLNSTFLALIPKIDELVSFADFLPISLCKKLQP